MYELSLYLFRRDLRLHDNTALLAALKASKKVMPCFIYDEKQLKNNQYKSDNCVQFMHESLQDLSDQLKQKSGKLYCFYGSTEKILKQLITKHKIQAIFLNRDYTPFSQKRDKKISQLSNIEFHSFSDYLLTEPELVHKKDGKPYTVFTPFFKTASQLSVPKPKTNPHTNYYTKTIPSKQPTISINEHLALRGGRTQALKLLKNLNKLNYKNRNFPALNTSHLSAHNKFGTVSIREVYHKITDHTLISELYWRDFFTHIAYHFPHVFGHAFHKKYDKIKWSKKFFKQWCEGKTGFPIVDAGMRELNTTGFMHNRVRMVVASFLVKDLHVDWRLGEKYFAQKLVDYDPSVNNGNWQWAASTGCDAQPYFRIFNPWLQQQKYDPDCIYIKKWVPELKNEDPKTIHNLFKKPIKGYQEPIIEHKKQAEIAKAMFKSV